MTDVVRAGMPVPDRRWAFSSNPDKIFWELRRPSGWLLDGAAICTGMVTMPAEKESRIAMWLEAVRAWAPTVRIRFAEWWTLVRQEPILLWHTPAIRYAAFAIGLVLALGLVTWVVGAFVPPLPPGTTEPARTAQFHVLCADPTCAHHFVIERKFRFDDFPVACPR